jgi:hypothetical protein
MAEKEPTPRYTAGAVATTTPAGEPAKLNAQIIDLGAAKRKNIRRLKRGRGPLASDVAAVLSEVENTAAAAGKTVLPVVVVVKRKKRRAKRALNPLGKMMGF